MASASALPLALPLASGAEPFDLGEAPAPLVLGASWAWASTGARDRSRPSETGAQSLNPAGRPRRRPARTRRGAEHADGPVELPTPGVVDELVDRPDPVGGAEPDGGPLLPRLEVLVDVPRQ